MKKLKIILKCLMLLSIGITYNTVNAQNHDPYHADSVLTPPNIYVPPSITPPPKTTMPTQDISSQPIKTAYSCATYRGQYDIDSQAIGTFYLIREGNSLNKSVGQIIGWDNSGCYQPCTPKTDTSYQSCSSVYGSGWTGSYVTRTDFYCTAGGYLKQGGSSNSDNCSAPTCSNGAGDYPTCTPPTCSNGGSNYPTCTPPSCGNGASDYPTCTPPYTPPPTCGNGASNYPTCTFPSSPTCGNGASNYPTCTFPTCSNGAGDYPTCTPPTPTKLCPYAGDVAGTQCDFNGYQGGDCIEGEYVWGKWVYNNDAACTTTQVESGSASGMQGYCPGRTGGSCPPGY